MASCFGLCNEKYPSDNIEGILKKYFGDCQLKDALTEILVTSYEIECRSPYFFKRSKAKAEDTSAMRNHLLRDVARATSAAPTYFEPAKVCSLGKSESKERHLIDGGVFANNPALCAYAEAVSFKKSPNEMLLVSLGTGISTKSIKYAKAKNWGKVSWINPVLSIMMDGVADAVDYQLKQMLRPDQYYHFNIHLQEATNDDLDAVDQANINALKDEARRILDDQKMGQRFKDVCEKLVE